MKGRVYKKTGINLLSYEKMSERKVYTIGNVCLLTCHVIYLAVFGILGVKPMMYYNIFSVLFYISTLIILHRTSLRTSLVLTALVEVMIHSCLGSLTLGWSMGFGTMLLFLIPIPFYLPLRHIITPYLFSLVPFGIYVWIAAVVKLNDGGSNEYVFRDPAINNILYFMNIIFAAMILLYISTIHMMKSRVMQFKLRSKNESLQKLATIDQQTQLFNRRAMNEYLKMVKYKGERSGKGCVVGLFDLDDLKEINDRHGYAAGDEVVKQAAAVIASAIPAEGYAARWDGEEFIFAIPDADLQKGIDCAEKVRTAFYEKSFKAQGRLFKATITAGVCRCEIGQEMDEVLSRAETLLNSGKNGGKNKTTY